MLSGEFYDLRMYAGILDQETF